MSASTQPKFPNSKSIPLRSFQTEKYYRSEEVAAQLEWLSSLSPSEMIELAQERAGGADYLIKEEAIVYLLRELNAKDEKRHVGRLLEILLKRIAPTLRRATQFIKNHSQTHCEQCVEEISSQVIFSLLDSSSKQEFWEVKFWLCLKRSIINVVDRFRRVIDNEMHTGVYVNDSGAEYNVIDLAPNYENEITQNRLEAEEALNLLPQRTLQAVRLLFEEDWTQVEVAAHFKVTDKTVRNWLTAAKKVLQRHYGVEKFATKD